MSTGEQSSGADFLGALVARQGAPGTPEAGRLRPRADLWVMPLAGGAPTPAAPDRTAAAELAESLPQATGPGRSGAAGGAGWARTGLGRLDDGLDLSAFARYASARPDSARAAGGGERPPTAEASELMSTGRSTRWALGDGISARTESRGRGERKASDWPEEEDRGPGQREAARPGAGSRELSGALSPAPHDAGLSADPEASQRDPGHRLRRFDTAPGTVRPVAFPSGTEVGATPGVGPRRSAAPEGRPRRAREVSPPAVEILIDRIDVRMPPPVAAEAESPRSSAPRVSLADYLASRDSR
jgi:hypothetical protein